MIAIQLFHILQILLSMLLVFFYHISEVCEAYPYSIQRAGIMLPLGMCVYSMASSTVIGLWRFSFTGLQLSACCLDSMALMPITSSRSWATTCGRSLNVKFSFCITYHFFGESAAKELNDSMLIPIIHDNPRIIMST